MKKKINAYIYLGRLHYMDVGGYAEIEVELTPEEWDIVESLIEHCPSGIARNYPEIYQKIKTAAAGNIRDVVICTNFDLDWYHADFNSLMAEDIASGAYTGVAHTSDWYDWIDEDVLPKMSYHEKASYLEKRFSVKCAQQQIDEAEILFD